MQRTKSGHSRERRVIFPPIPKSAKCGKCINCLFPSRNQACATRRQEMLAMIEKESMPATQNMESDEA